MMGDCEGKGSSATSGQEGERSRGVQPRAAIGLQIQPEVLIGCQWRQTGTGGGLFLS